jgi:hypothetical protein
MLLPDLPAAAICTLSASRYSPRAPTTKPAAQPPAAPLRGSSVCRAFDTAACVKEKTPPTAAVGDRKKTGGKSIGGRRFEISTDTSYLRASPNVEKLFQISQPSWIPTEQCDCAPCPGEYSQTSLVVVAGTVLNRRDEGTETSGACCSGHAIVEGRLLVELHGLWFGRVLGRGSHCVMRWR